MPAFDRKTPVRYPSGISIYPPRHVLRNFQYVSNDYLIYKNEDFLPYRTSDYTVTNTNGTAAQATLNGGSVKLSTAGSTSSDKIMLANAAPFQQFMLGNQQFFDARIAISGSFSDVNMYCGLSDNVDLSASSNGIYFLKPSGGTTVNLIVKKGGTSTTFQNVADLAKPSGLYSDSFAVPAVASATIAGGNYTLPVITTPGSGYRVSPLVLATGATGANATLVATLGGSANLVQNPSNLATQIPYAPLANLWITNAGNAAYTTGLIEIDPWINLEFYYNGFGVFLVGINGREVMSIRGSAVEQGFTSVAAGNTVNVATVGPSFNASGTQLTTTNFGPQVPTVGDPMNIFPLVPLQVVTGFVNTTANARAMYWDEYNVATEFN